MSFIPLVRYLSVLSLLQAVDLCSFLMFWAHTLFFVKTLRDFFKTTLCLSKNWINRHTSPHEVFAFPSVALQQINKELEIHHFKPSDIVLGCKVSKLLYHIFNKSHAGWSPILLVLFYLSFHFHLKVKVRLIFIDQFGVIYSIIHRNHDASL